MGKIAIVGYGNVGSHLAKESTKNHQVAVFSGNPRSGESNLNRLNPSDFDFILLTVPDGVIKEVSEKLEVSGAIILHTSGSRPLSDLKKHKRIGVLYPLQTLSKEKEIDFKQIQFFVEGTHETERAIIALASCISDKVKTMSSLNRSKIHLAAVFACNFSNHMFHIAEHQLNDIGMKFQDILPLVNETLEKAVALNPSNSQTGPAVRRDKITIESQLKLLKENEQLIYEMITKNIQKYH